MEEGIETLVSTPVRFPSEPWAILQEDTSILYDYIEVYRQRVSQEPEKRLMLAVLEDAVACFQKYIFARDSKGKALFREAEEYILEQYSNWVFSFENICEELGMQPGYVRQGLVRWKEQRLANALPKSAKRKYIRSR